MITHPDKVLFPDDGITKGELAAYYEAIAPIMVPHIRAAAGHDGAVSRRASASKGFLQKDVSKGFPEWLERVEVPKKGGTVHHPLVCDTRSLLWLANQNCITPHVWTSRAPRPVPARHLRLRSRPVRRRAGRPARGRARGARPAGRAGPAKLGEDIRLEGIPHRRSARRQGRLRRGRAVRPRRRHDPRQARSASTSRRSSARPIAAGASSSTPDATATAPRSRRPTPCAPSLARRCPRRAPGQELENGQVGPQTFTARTMAKRVADVGDLWVELPSRGRSLKQAMSKVHRLSHEVAARP